MNTSYKFKDPQELLDFIKKEIRNYIGKYDDNVILYRYNRMTIDELAQEVYIKLLRTAGHEVNKKYVRQSVIYVCIDYYRLASDQDPVGDLENCKSMVCRDSLKETERLLQLKKFSEKEIKIISLLLEGYRNPEIREILKMPKMTYYTSLKRLRESYGSIVDKVDQEVWEAYKDLESAGSVGDLED